MKGETLISLIGLIIGNVRQSYLDYERCFIYQSEWRPLLYLVFDIWIYVKQKVLSSSKLSHEWAFKTNLNSQCHAAGRCISLFVCTNNLHQT